jgi:hypothetical protein
MKKIIAITSLVILTVATGCKKDSEFLNVQPFQPAYQRAVFY